MTKRLYWIYLALLFNSVANAQTDISYCVDPNWAPYESIEQGKHVGISSHYLNLISQYSDLSFSLHPTTTWQESINAFNLGLCQLIPMLNQSEDRKQTMGFTKDYFFAANVLYTKLNKTLLAGFSSLNDEKVAVVQDYRLHHYLARNYPKLTLVPVQNEAVGLTQLSEGKVDFFVGSFYSSNQLIQELALANLKIAGIAELQDNLRVGVSHDIGYIIPQINAAIDQFSAKDHGQVFNELQRKVVVSETDYSLVWKVIGVAFLILLVIATKHYESLKQRRILSVKNDALERLRIALEKKNEQLAELTIRDHLTKLFNRLHLSEHIEANIRLKARYGTPCCLILIDVDDFKEFNDNFGHKVGDDVLIEVANILFSVSRNTDICARWGGEEFAILCPATELDAALALSNRFQQELSEIDNNLLPQITCSIGVSELAKTQSESSWFTQTDEALYQAKAKGKNCIHISH